MRGSYLHLVNVIVDDILVWGKDDEEHDARLKQVLPRAREAISSSMQINALIKDTEVPYFGHVLSKDGLKEAPVTLRAVKEISPL